jgi:hypothetical protein
MYFLLKFALWVFCFRFALKGREGERKWYQLALALGFAGLTIPEGIFSGWREAVAIPVYLAVCPLWLHGFLEMESIFKSLLFFAAGTLLVFFALPWLLNLGS